MEAFQRLEEYIPELPIFQEDSDDIDAYICGFETQARILNWLKEMWSLNLAAKLQGPALNVYCTLARKGEITYEMLKEKLLWTFQRAEEEYREEFRTVQPHATESMTAFLKRMSYLADRWISRTQIMKDYQHLRDLLPTEQYYQSVSKDLSIHLRERGLTTADALAE